MAPARLASLEIAKAARSPNFGTLSLVQYNTDLGDTFAVVDTDPYFIRKKTTLFKMVNSDLGDTHVNISKENRKIGYFWSKFSSFLLKCCLLAWKNGQINIMYLGNVA